MKKGILFFAGGALAAVFALWGGAHAVGIGKPGDRAASMMLMMPMMPMPMCPNCRVAANIGQPGDSAAAKSNHCVGCHNIPGYRSVFPTVYPVPKIIGQSAKYIEHALRAYRSGERKHPSMNGIAAQLSDEDIKLLADWYAGGAE